MKRCVVLFLAFLTIPNFLWAEDRQLADRVLAVVNNDVITQSEFDVVFQSIYEQVKETHQGADLRKALEEIRLQLLNQMIEDKLVFQEAEKMGIVISPEEIQERMKAFKSQFVDEETYEQEMERADLTQAALEQQFRERLAIARLHEYMIRGSVVVSPSEVEQYYQDHQDKFKDKDRVNVWSITIRKSDEAIEKGIADEKAKQKAEDLLVQLKAGADFKALAKEHSEDANASGGGALGYVERGDLVDEIDRVLFSLPDASYSEVLETDRGYHLFKIEDKQIALEKTFEEVRDEVRDAVFRVKAHERFVDWMKELKEKSYISIR